MKFLIGVLVSALGASLRRVKSIFCLSASTSRARTGLYYVGSSCVLALQKLAHRCSQYIVSPDDPIITRDRGESTRWRSVFH
jgi:hypothetical protein